MTKNGTDRIAELEAENRALRSRLAGLEDSGPDGESTVKSIFAASPTGIGLVVERVFLRANDRLCEMLGYRPEEMLGKNARMVYESDAEFERVGREKYEEIAGRGVGTVETRWVRKDGQVIDVLVSSAPLDPSDLTRGVTFTALDITASKEADEQLQQVQELVSAIASAAEDSIFVKDLERRYTFVNQAMERTLGLPAVEVLGKTPEELFDAAAAATIREVDTPALAGQVVDEIHNLEIAGQLVTFHTVQVPLHDQAGLITGICGIVRDVTAQRKDEQERLRLLERMQQAQKLESLGVLAGGIAHDFNNLLVGILGNAGLAMLEMNPEAPARERVADIERAAQRASELIRQMLAYSGKGQMVTERIDLRSTVEEMAHLLSTSISKKAHLSFAFGEAVPTIVADATEIRQLAMNLITNASDALGDKDGDITVSTGVIDCDEVCLADTWLGDDLPTGTYAYLEVSDTGDGMPPETQARIFDPFFSTKFTGHGLGLAAVLGIVRSHRGALWVDSFPGQGTTFRILLPASEGSASPLSDEPERVSTWRGEGMVLVADDEETVRDVSRQMLERLGFEVVCAADGLEAVEIFRQTPDRFTAVLLDLTMPRMSGEECFDALTALRPDACILLSSGYSEHELTQRFEGRGLAGFVQKPFRLDDLARSMRLALEPG